jgi:hypothetical protein
MSIVLIMAVFNGAVGHMGLRGGVQNSTQLNKNSLDARKSRYFSQMSVVTFRMGYGLDGWGSIHGKGKRFFFTESRRALGPTQPPIQSTPWALSPGVKQSGREADHSPPSSAEIKNIEATSLLPHTSS